jgi:SAM-dependent methyltransferase
MIATTADDLSGIAAHLARHDDGIWYAQRAGAVDYPDEGNAFCFQVEDTSFWFRHRNDCIISTVRKYPARGPILDLGAGNGFVARGLEQAGFPTIVLEPGPTGIRNARTRGLTRLVCASFEDAGFRPASLAGIGLFDVLEHVADENAFLRGIATATQSGGRLYATVPAYQALWSTEDNVGGHHRRYTASRLARALVAAGFTPEYTTYFFAPLPIPILLFRALPYRLRPERQLDLAKVQATLEPRESAASRMLGNVLRWEAGWLRRGFRIPFGSSVLMVARK